MGANPISDPLEAPGPAACCAGVGAPTPACCAGAAGAMRMSGSRAPTSTGLNGNLRGHARCKESLTAAWMPNVGMRSTRSQQIFERLDCTVWIVSPHVPSRTKPASIQSNGSAERVRLIVFPAMPVCVPILQASAAEGCVGNARMSMSRRLPRRWPAHRMQGRTIDPPLHREHGWQCPSRKRNHGHIWMREVS